MRHRPMVLRLLAALVIAFGLIGSVVSPTLAQDDATPTPEDSSAVPENEVVPAGVGTGSLLLLYYLCDGGEGFLFDASADPGNGNPNPPVDDCAPSSLVDGTDATFLVYEFGDLNSTPRELTTVDGVIMDDTLPTTDGTPHKITQKLPEESEETPIEADFEIVQDTITGVNAIQFRTGSIELHKYLCAGNADESFIQALNPGEELNEEPYVDCSPATHDFTVQPYDDPENFATIALTTEGGVASNDEVPTTSLQFSPHKITEDGTELVAIFDVEPGETTILVAVNYAEAMGELEINKLACIGDESTQFYIDEDAPQSDDPDCSVADADFSIYPFGDTEGDAITVSTSGGTANVSELPITDDSDPHLLVEDGTGAEVEFVIAEASTTVINVVNFEPPAAEDGTVEIEKLDCSGLLEPVIEVGEPGDDAAGIPGNCSGGTASFIIYPFSDDEAEPIQLTVEGFESLQLPPTEGTQHKLIEVDGSGVPVATAFFDVESGNFTPIQVQNPTYGSVTIYSYECEGDQDSWFEVFDPGQSPDLPTDCSLVDRNFEISVFQGLGSEVFSTGSDGIATVVGVPATASVGHAIEKNSGVQSAVFHVDADETTFIVSYVLEPDDDNGTGGVIDDDDDSENVDDLPDTGTGQTGQVAQTGSAALLYGLLSVITMVGLAALARRRIV